MTTDTAPSGRLIAPSLFAFGIFYGGIAGLMKLMQSESGSVIRTRPVLGFGDLRVLDDAASRKFTPSQPSNTYTQQLLRDLQEQQLDYQIRLLGQKKGI